MQVSTGRGHAKPCCSVCDSPCSHLAAGQSRAGQVGVDKRRRASQVGGQAAGGPHGPREQREAHRGTAAPTSPNSAPISPFTNPGVQECAKPLLIPRKVGYLLSVLCSPAKGLPSDSGSCSSNQVSLQPSYRALSLPGTCTHAALASLPASPQPHPPQPTPHWAAPFLPGAHGWMCRAGTSLPQAAAHPHQAPPPGVLSWGGTTAGSRPLPSAGRGAGRAPEQGGRAARVSRSSTPRAISPRCG